MTKAIRRPRPHIKKLRRLARDAHIDLWSMDEIHFQQHGTRCRMWVPPEDKDPIVLHAPTRKSVALFGAVNVRTGQLVTMLTPQFDAETFRAFLTILLRHRRRDRKIYVILDNARYHHATILQPYLRNHRQFLRLDFLPAYGPDLNPIERAWKLLRKLRTHNQHFETLEALVAAVTPQLILWRTPNPVLAKLCGII